MSAIQPSIPAESQWRADNKSRVLSLKRASNDHLNLITIVLGAHVMDLECPAAEVAEELVKQGDEAIKALRALLKCIGGIDPRRGGFRFVVRYEFDLVRPSEVRVSETKRRLLEGLGADIALLTAAPDRAILVPHFHIVLDTNGNDRRAMDKALRKQWQGRRRVKVQQFWKHQTALKNLTTVGNYAFKMSFAHTNAYETDDDTTEVKIERTADYSPLWERWMRDLIIACGLDALAFNNLRAKPEEKSEPDDACSVECVNTYVGAIPGVTADSEPSQSGTFRAELGRHLDAQPVVNEQWCEIPGHSTDSTSILSQQARHDEIRARIANRVASALALPSSQQNETFRAKLADRLNRIRSNI